MDILPVCVLRPEEVSGLRELKLEAGDYEMPRGFWN